jgi:hypothetical protein
MLFLAKSWPVVWVRETRARDAKDATALRPQVSAAMAAVARTELEPDLELAWDVAYTTLSKRGTPGVIYSTAQVSPSPRILLLLGSRIQQAWQLATAYLDARVVAGRDQSDQCPPETMRALQALEEVRLQDDLLEWYLGELRSAERRRSWLMLYVRLRLGAVSVWARTGVHPPVVGSSRGALLFNEDWRRHELTTAVPQAQAKVPEDMLELLNLIGFWMRAWQRPIETFWA